jgi:hypothetical protein
LKPRIVFHVVAVLVLIGAVVAAAQSPEPKAKPVSQGQSHDSASSQPPAPEHDFAGRSQYDNAALGDMAVGRRPGTILFDPLPMGPFTQEGGVSNGLARNMRPHSDLHALNDQKNLAHSESSRQQ